MLQVDHAIPLLIPACRPTRGKETRHEGQAVRPLDSLRFLEPA